VTKLEIGLIGIVAALILFVGWSFWERHEGAVSCENTDKADVAKQEAYNAALLVSQSQAIAKEKQTYEDALLQPINAPVARLCISTATVPKAPTPTGGTHAAPASPVLNQPDLVQGPDIGLPINAVARQADAEIAALQGYITNVCLK
jgi:hypothetical protein